MANQLTVSMTSLKTLLTSVSSDVVICIRGRHAVGKSESVAQAAKDLGLPLVMRRLSQMTEGDLLGLPEMVQTKNGQNATSFRPCEWLLRAVEEPCVLFLDERNRALDAVKQAVFELCDSRGFYGYELHPDSRIVIAENVGDNYQVQACDPAEVSRCVTVELDPSPKEWIDYATSKGINPLVVDFIRSNEKALEFNAKNFEPNKKYPDRRSWYKFAVEAEKLGLFDRVSDPMLYVLAGGFLGPETAQPFVDFCKTYNKQVSVHDILDNWDAAKRKLIGKKVLTKSDIVSNEKYAELGNKVSDHVKLDSAADAIMKSQAQVDNLVKFLTDAPAEITMNILSQLASKPKLTAVLLRHPDYKSKILKTIR